MSEMISPETASVDASPSEHALDPWTASADAAEPPPPDPMDDLPGASTDGDVLRAAFPQIWADLDGVQLHTGSAAAALAEAHDARAVTIGQDIHIGAGEDLASADGTHLLAHEVAHTLQQQPSAQAREVTAPDSPAEVEADRFADALSAGRPAPRPTARLDGAVARSPRDGFKKAPRASRLRAEPHALFFHGELSGRPVTEIAQLENRGSETVTIGGVVTVPGEVAGVARPPGDFAVAGLAAGTEVPAGGVAPPMVVSFHPQRHFDSDADDTTDRSTRAIVVDLEGRELAAVRLYGTAKPPGGKRAHGKKHGGRSSAPHTYADMLRDLEVAGERLRADDYDAAIPLIDGVAAELDHDANDERIRLFYREAGFSERQADAAVEVIDVARSSVGDMQAHAQSRGSVAIDHDITGFSSADAELRVVLGETKTKLSQSGVDLSSEQVDHIRAYFADKRARAAKVLARIDDPHAAETARVYADILAEVETAVLTGGKVDQKALWDRAHEGMQWGFEETGWQEIGSRHESDGHFHSFNEDGVYGHEPVAGYDVDQLYKVATQDRDPAPTAVDKALDVLREILNAAFFLMLSGGTEFLPGESEALPLPERTPEPPPPPPRTVRVGEPKVPVGAATGEAEAAAADLEAAAGAEGTAVPGGGEVDTEASALTPEERKKLVKTKDLHPKRDGAKIAAKTDETGMAIGRRLDSAARGHALLDRLAAGDASALEEIGVRDLPKDYNPAEREFMLLETRDGYVIAVGGPVSGDVPAGTRLLGHTHPESVLTDTGGRLDLSLRNADGDASAGVTFDEIAQAYDTRDPGHRGIVPSAADVDAAGEGGSQVLHTRYRHAGGGKIVNPGPGVEGPQVNVEISDIRVLDANASQGYSTYEARFTVRAGDDVLWTGTVYAKRYSLQGFGDKVWFKPPADVQRLLAGGGVTP